MCKVQQSGVFQSCQLPVKEYVYLSKEFLADFMGLVISFCGMGKVEFKNCSDRIK
jgi:hypothetical protein